MYIRCLGKREAYSKAAADLQAAATLERMQESLKLAPLGRGTRGAKRAAAEEAGSRAAWRAPSADRLSHFIQWTQPVSLG